MLISHHSFISLCLFGVIYAFIGRRLWVPAILLFVLQYGGYALYAVLRGFPSPASLALGIAKTPSLINLFALGLVAGSLSFGGVYTSIPFVQVEAVLKGAWLPQSVFIDCIAISNVLPAPLVIFSTFVGFQGGLIDGGLGHAFAGAVVITLGMFFPCFVFTIVGHGLLEKLVRNKVGRSLSPAAPLAASQALTLPQLLSDFFDGLCGAVVGVVSIIACQILKASVVAPSSRGGDSVATAIERASQSGLAAVLYILALAILYRFPGKYAAPLLFASAAVAGQFLLA
jgi:chromate transport protein ChrA